MVSDVKNKHRKIEPEFRIGALDLGEKRIGVAISDETHTLARSFGTLKRSSRAADFEKIKSIIEENQINLIIIGLPTLSSGKEGTKAAWARDYALDLSTTCHIKVVLWDESYTTVDAQESLRDRNIKGRRQRNRIDEVAAAFILQSYLDRAKTE